MTDDIYYDPMTFDFDTIDFGQEDEEGNIVYGTKSDEPVDEVIEDIITSPTEPLDITSLFDQADDDAIIDFGGVKLSKSSVKELALSKEKIEAETGFLTEAANNIRHAEKHRLLIEKRAMSEVDRHINALTRELERDDITDAERGARLRELKQWNGKKADLDQDLQQYAQLVEAQRAQIQQARVIATDQAMQARYGNEWSKNAQETYEFAIKEGVPFEAISETLCPALANIFVMARKYKEFEATQKAKVRSDIQATVARSKKVSSHTSIQRETSASRSAALNAKAAKGQATQEDILEAFTSFLK